MGDAMILRVSATSGSVDVAAEPGRADIEAGGARLERDGQVATVNAGSSRAAVRVPVGTTVIVGSSSGRVRVTGQVGAVSVVTGSGSVVIEDAQSVDVRSTSGTVRIGRVTGECRVTATSARVEVERCGSVHMSTRSGRAHLGAVDGPASLHCVSGRVDVTMAGAYDVDAETVSGRVAVSLPAGVRPQVVSSPGEVPDDAHDCVVLARSVSGRVDVTNR
jgi:DUF4097 and DUF4098 domain-containing protein YvlB